MASLGQMGIEAVPQLIGLMADEDVVIREAAATAVVRIGPVAFDQMLEALTDDEWAIREQAANALGRFRDSRAVDPLTAHAVSRTVPDRPRPAMGSPFAYRTR